MKISIYFLIFVLCLFQDAKAQNGIVKSYYTDGTVQSEASYVNDVLDGAYLTYYPNGKIKTEKNFSQGILDGYIREYFSNGLMKEEYFVKLGIKDGSHRVYLENGQLKELIHYSSGILTSEQMFSNEYNNLTTKDSVLIGNKPEMISFSKESVEKNSELVTYKKVLEEEKKVNSSSDKKQMEFREEPALSEVENEILCDAQVCPIPIGGMKTIKDNLIYPDHALRYGLEGTVTIIATIDAQGDVIKTQVLKKLGFGCDEAAQDVLRKTKFIPARNNDQPVETNATIAIEFKIIGKKLVQ